MLSPDGEEPPARPRTPAPPRRPRGEARGEGDFGFSSLGSYRFHRGLAGGPWRPPPTHTHAPRPRAPHPRGVAGSLPAPPPCSGRLLAAPPASLAAAWGSEGAPRPRQGAPRTSRRRALPPGGGRLLAVRPQAGPVPSLGRCCGPQTPFCPRQQKLAGALTLGSGSVS